MCDSCSVSVMDKRNKAAVFTIGILSAPACDWGTGPLETVSTVMRDVVDMCLSVEAAASPSHHKAMTMPYSALACYRRYRVKGILLPWDP